MMFDSMFVRRLIRDFNEELEELSKKVNEKSIQQVRLDYVKFCVELSYKYKKPLKQVFDDIEKGFNLLDMPKQTKKKKRNK